MLKKDFRNLYNEMLETFMAGCRGEYPKSHSDLEHGLAALIKMFEIKRRPIALESIYPSEKERAAEERAEHAYRGDSVESHGSNGYILTVRELGCKANCRFGYCICEK
jgi:hypothetical protein